MIIKCIYCKKLITDRAPYGLNPNQQVEDGVCDTCLNQYFPHQADRIKTDLSPFNQNTPEHL